LLLSVSSTPMSTLFPYTTLFRSVDGPASSRGSADPFIWTGRGGPVEAGRRVRPRRRSRAGGGLHPARRPGRAGVRRFVRARPAPRSHAVLPALAGPRGPRFVPGRPRRVAPAPRRLRRDPRAGGARPRSGPARPALAWRGAATRPADEPRPLPAGGDPCRTRLGLAQPQGPRACAGRGLGAGCADRRAVGEPPQDRARLLAHDDVPRLRAQPRPVPLGVAEQHHGRLSHRTAVPAPP